MIKKNLLTVLIIFSFFCSCSQKENKSFLIISPRQINLGDIRANTNYDIIVTVKNNSSSKVIQLKGISETCTCVYDTLNLPKIINAEGEMKIHFVYNNHDTSLHNNFMQKIVLHTDSDSLFQMIEIFGRII